MERPIFWIGTSLADLKAFPLEVRKEAGFQLHVVQTGQAPDDWKPFNDIGKGVREIRITDSSGIFRIMYLAKFKEGIYVLHSFQKKTQKTRKQDIDIAKIRYQAIISTRLTR
jgi:phage-related protein